MSKNKLVIGRGTKVTVALLPDGSRASIAPQVITLSAAAAAQDANLSVSALTGPIVASLADPVFLTFEAPDGTDRFVKVVASAAAGATSLTVEPVRLAIPSASIADYPVRLLSRTSVDITPNANDITTDTFENDGYEDGIVTKIGYGINCPGNFLPLDAGYRTCVKAFNEFREVYLSIELPAPAGYAHGYIYRGVAGVTNAPLKAPADGVISADLDFKTRGKIEIIEPSIA